MTYLDDKNQIFLQMLVAFQEPVLTSALLDHILHHCSVITINGSSYLNFLDTLEYNAYWANTSSNSLIGKLIREGHPQIKKSFEDLLHGNSIKAATDEQIVYDQLDGSEEAIRSLLLASGYLKVLNYEKYQDKFLNLQPEYELTLTNLEVKITFQNMIRKWFGEVKEDHNDFVKALLLGDLDAMNEYMNRVSFETFSYLIPVCASQIARSRSGSIMDSYSG